jgi:hypothetical protein
MKVKLSEIATKLLNLTEARMRGEVTYARLPEKPPYGFWITRDLRIIVCRSRNHAFAAAIALEPTVKSFFDIDDAIREKVKKEVIRLGWMDTVIRNDKFSKTIWFRTKECTPTEAQKRLVYDIGAYYDLAVEEDPNT